MFHILEPIESSGADCSGSSMFIKSFNSNILSILSFVTLPSRLKLYLAPSLSSRSILILFLAIGIDLVYTLTLEQIKEELLTSEFVNIHGLTMNRPLFEP